MLPLLLLLLLLLQRLARLSSCLACWKSCFCTQFSVDLVWSDVISSHLISSGRGQSSRDFPTGAPHLHYSACLIFFCFFFLFVSQIIHAMPCHVLSVSVVNVDSVCSYRNRDQIYSKITQKRYRDVSTAVRSTALHGLSSIMVTLPDVYVQVLSAGGAPV